MAVSYGKRNLYSEGGAVMLHVIPIQDKNEQKALCDHFNTSFDMRSFAYLAAECDNNDSITSVIGFMQFSVNDSYAQVSSFTYENGCTDSEAMQIMARTAFSFIYRLGVPEVRISKGVFDGETCALLFPCDMGEYRFIDVKKFYESRCGDR